MSIRNIISIKVIKISIHYDKEKKTTFFCCTCEKVLRPWLVFKKEPVWRKKIHHVWRWNFLIYCHLELFFGEIGLKQKLLINEMSSKVKLILEENDERKDNLRRMTKRKKIQTIKLTNQVIRSITTQFLKNEWKFFWIAFLENVNRQIRIRMIKQIANFFFLCLCENDELTLMFGFDSNQTKNAIQTLQINARLIVEMERKRNCHPVSSISNYVLAEKEQFFFDRPTVSFQKRDQHTNN